MKYVFLLQVLFLITSAGYSQQKQIRGKVTDTDNQPIEFSNVALYSLPDSTFVTGTVSDQQGEFSLTLNDNINAFLKISFIGYETQTVPAVSEQTVVLKADSIFLDEVVVQGHRKVFQMENGNIVANVSGTLLGKEVTVLEVLRKIPGMTLKDEQLSSFIGGTPIIYVNGKKVQSITEVKQLEVKNIKSVELNTNPGAEYDSSAGAVLLIITHNRLDGLALHVETMARLNSYFTYNNSLKINYKKDKINLFGQIGYSDYRKKTGQNLTTIIYAPDTTWRSYMPMRELSRFFKTLEYTAGGDYTFSKKHSIGLKYDGSFNHTYSLISQPLTLWANDKVFKTIDGLSDKSDKENSHYINAYYRGKLTDKLQMELYADWLKRQTNGNQTVTEKPTANEKETTKVNTQSDNKLFGITPKFRYAFNARHQLSAGTEFNSVGVQTMLKYEPEILSDTRSETSETKFAGYLDYSYNNENGFIFGTGLRYEWVNSRYNDLLNDNNNIHRSYSNVFPNVRVSYRKGLITQSLSYRSGITRPSYSVLNGSTYYVNEFVYQEGNPKLEPEILHNIQYNLMYRYIYFSLRYNNIKNSIQSELQSLTPTSNIIKNTWINYDNLQQIKAILNLRYTFGAYTPSLTLAYMQNFLNVSTNKGLEKIKKPYGYVDLNNDIDLSNGFLFNVQYTYTGRGTFGMFYIEPTHVFNARVQKTFFKDKLQLSLTAKDIFGKDIIRLNGQVHHIYMHNEDYQDRRSLIFNVVWRFNNYQKTYKGQSVSQDEINRL